MTRWLLFPVALLGTAAFAQAAQPRSYALIVANGQDLDPATERLEYADDDAARWAELMSAFAVETKVLAVLDAPTRALHPEIATQALAPSRANLKEQLDRLFKQIRADRAAGLDTRFFFVLIGHGHVGAGGEGYVSLLDGPFSRGDLFQWVVRSSPATTNHLVVDACDAYFMVQRRGESSAAAPVRRSAIAAYLDQENLARFPNTGVLLATTRAKPTHEWSGFQAGVFSYELRSGLSGAADANGDGQVSYLELEAFVSAANSGIANPEAHVEMFAHAPAGDPLQTFADLRSAHFAGFLALRRGPSVHVAVEDARGVRYADIHSSGERVTFVGLPSLGQYWVRSPDYRKELEVRISGPAPVEVDGARMSEARITQRGSVEQSFLADLFREPFGPKFLRGFQSARGYPQVRASERWVPMGWAQPTDSEVATGKVFPWLPISGAALGAIGGGLSWWARTRTIADFSTHLDGAGNVVGLSPAAAQSMQTQARIETGVSLGLFTAAAAATVASLVVWGHEDAGRSIAVAPTLGAGETGAAVSWTF